MLYSLKGLLPSPDLILLPPPPTHTFLPFSATTDADQGDEISRGRGAMIAPRGHCFVSARLHLVGQALLCVLKRVLGAARGGTQITYRKLTVRVPVSTLLVVLLLIRNSAIRRPIYGCNRLHDKERKG